MIYWKNQQKYTAEWLLQECKENRWGDVDEWKESLNGCVSGWNHVAQRVTTDTGRKGMIVGGEKKKKKVDPDHEEGKDDEKEEKKQHEEDDNDNDNDNDNNNDMDDIVGDKNPFKKFVVLADACEALTILKIEPKGDDPKAPIQPSDVPLIFGIDSDKSEFTVSKMIRFMLDHLIEANNKLLRICHGLDNDDKGEQIGFISTTELSQRREHDVINIDEEELLLMIQNCAKPRLRYGEDNELSLDSFNLRLLEHNYGKNILWAENF